MKHAVKILEKHPLTHDVNRYLVERPANYDFQSGQATDIAINKPGWTEELRPFTFTGLNSEEFLEFTIKSYMDHDGVTRQLASLHPGDELILHDVFGAITYKGPGVFIAGGAGITPFISIFRQLKKDNEIHGNSLIFANKTENDIILKDEFQYLLADQFYNVIAHPVDGSPGERIGKALLQDHIDTSSFYYICGPDQMVADVAQDLKNLGIADSHIVTEEWA